MKLFSSPKKRGTSKAAVLSKLERKLEAKKKKAAQIKRIAEVKRQLSKM
jgi:hypothetical protein